MKSENRVKGYKKGSKDWEAEYNMLLDDGLTCNDCQYIKRCCTLFGQTPYINEGKCQFYPNRFAAKKKSQLDCEGLCTAPAPGMVTYEYGDILDWVDKVNIIAHQVNCQGIMGGGLALQIKNKWPEVNESYTDLVNESAAKSRAGRSKLMGFCQIVQISPKSAIANLFGQFDIGGGRQTDYEALFKALRSLREQMMTLALTSVAFPVRLGCGLAGGDWGVVQSLIKGAFEESGISITLVEYSPKG